MAASTRARRCLRFMPGCYRLQRPRSRRGRLNIGARGGSPPTDMEMRMKELRSRGALAQALRPALQPMFAMLFALLVAPLAAAQDYPSKPVRIVVPFAAGGPADVYARFIAQRLQDSMGQTFIVDDRPGAGSIIGTDAVAKSPPDGYTLLLMSNTHTVNESLIPTKPFQLMRDRDE